MRRDLCESVNRGGFPPLRWIESLRLRTERLIDVIYTETAVETSISEPSLHAQLLKGILLGKRSDVPTETLDIFRNSGTFHVLAVSGLHVGPRRDVLLFRAFALQISTEASLSLDNDSRANLRLPRPDSVPPSFVRP